MERIAFDEGMNDLPPDLVPLNVVHVQRTQNGEPLPAEVEETSVDQFTFQPMFLHHGKRSSSD